MKSKIIIFLIKIVVLYLLWFIVAELLINTRFWQAVNSIFLREVLFLSKYTLIVVGKIFNFGVNTYSANPLPGALHDTIILYPANFSATNYPELFIDNRCLALDLMYTYSVFIIAFVGPFRQKLWFIPLGLLVINTLNIFRITGLGLTAIYYPQYLNFNHHILFVYVVYFFTFILWVIWIRKFARQDLIKIIEVEKDNQKKNSN